MVLIIYFVTKMGGHMSGFLPSPADPRDGAHCHHCDLGKQMIIKTTAKIDLCLYISVWSSTDFVTENKKWKLLLRRQSGDWAVNQPTEMWARGWGKGWYCKMLGRCRHNRLGAHCESNVTDRCIVHLAIVFRSGVTGHRPVDAWFDSRLGLNHPDRIFH